MRVLITGANGQLGCELTTVLKAKGNELGEIPGVYFGAEVDAVDRGELDIADDSAVRKWFSEHDPYQVVFNCAAYTDVDGCETDEKAAFRVNAEGPRNLARACASTDAVLVHVSTDYVFPGDEPGSRCEGDPTGPLSAYGRTKLAGERLVLNTAARVHVVRTAWLYGREGHNFVRSMMDLSKHMPSVTVVDDQVGNPTNAADLAFELLRIAQSEEYGLWHATCEGECTWADFAEAIMEEVGESCRVERCTSIQWREMHPGVARRPAFSSLENNHLKQSIGNSMRPWRTALASFVANEVQKVKVG